MRLPAVLRRRNVARRGHEHPEAAGGMIDALWWYVTVLAIGLAAFPIAYALLPRLTDRGYSVSKPLGILVIGYLSWMLAVLHVVPSVRLSITMLLLLMASVSAWYAWGRRHELLAFMTRELKREKLTKEQINRATAAIGHEWNAPGDTLATVIDATTLIAQQFDMFEQANIERAAARMMQRGLAAADNGRILVHA